MDADVVPASSAEMTVDADAKSLSSYCFYPAVAEIPVANLQRKRGQKSCPFYHGIYKFLRINRNFVK